MTQTNFTNNPISFVITSTSTTVTVPSNEVWRVNAVCHVRSTVSDDRGTFLAIDGVKVAGAGGDTGAGMMESQATEMILKGGQTIEMVTHSAQDHAIFISGFVIDT